ncbi:MAG: hypothetical protein EON92_12545, partial [Burkholderiales bacterium]
SWTVRCGGPCRGRRARRCRCPRRIRWCRRRRIDRRGNRSGILRVSHYRHASQTRGSQEHRSQEMNRAGAFARLQELVDSVAVAPKVRRPTKPTKGSQMRRLDGKAQRGQVKALRGKVTH